MDEEHKIAYILTGIALIGQIYFSTTYIHKFAIPISIILLFFSIIGSLRARLVLIGFLLYFYFISFNGIIVVLTRAFNDTILKTFIITSIIILAAIILLFRSINIEETSSRFSERTPINLTAVLFLILIIWNFTRLFILPILNYEKTKELISYGFFDMKSLFFGLIFLILSTFIAFSLYRKKTIGFVLAPIVLTMVTIDRINSLLSELYGDRFYKLLNIFDILSYYILPLLATALIIFFIFCLKEDNLGIVNVITKKKYLKRILLITAISLSCIALLFVGLKIKNPLSLKWRYKATFFINSSPVVVDGVIYLGNRLYYLQAIDKETGKQIWKFYEDEISFESPSVFDGVIYVGGWDSQFKEQSYLYAINTATGKLKWRFELGASEAFYYSPTIVDGMVYIGSGDHHLYAVDASSGELRWRFKTEDAIFSSVPAVADGVVCVTSRKNLYAIDANNGELKWLFKIECPIRLSPTMVDGVVYMGTTDGYLNAIDINSGDQRWRLETRGSVSTYIIVVDDVIYFRSGDSYLCAVDANNGELKWCFETEGCVSTSPTVVKDVVYVGAGITTSNCYLYAINSDSGVLKWKYNTEYTIASAIIIVDDVIYFGNLGGYLFAMEIKK